MPGPTCTAKPPCDFRTVPMEEITLVWGGEAIGRKAVAVPASKTIYLDPTFWGSIRYISGRAIIFCHEWAHLEGARCEECADYRGGQLLHRLGVPTSRDARRAMLAALDNRDAQAAADNVAAGYGVDDAVPAGEKWKTVTAYRNGEPFDLVVIEVQPGSGFWAAAGMVKAWRAAQAAAEAAGIAVGVSSAFRSQAEQTRLYDGFKAGLPGFNPADPPGYSKHQAGDAIDGKWATVEQREAFAELAARFGLKRTVSREPWHFVHQEEVGALPLFAAAALVLGKLS